MTAHLTISQRAMARRLRAKGMSLRVIAKEIGCSHSGIDVMLKGQARAPRADTWMPRAGNLTAGDREEILLGLHRGESMSQIARDLNRSASSVTREVMANGARKRYRIWPAHERARTRTLRPKPSKLDKGPLCDRVTMGLESLWSPEEIARRLRREFPDESSMRVSHETIYQSLFVQGRGELRRELARCLRSGRTTRRARGSTERRGKIPDMVMIADRPVEAADRAVPGHWESQWVCQAA